MGGVYYIDKGIGCRYVPSMLMVPMVLVLMGLSGRAGYGRCLLYR